jgi:hypothetical protein
LGTQLSGGSFGVSTLHLIQEYQQREFLSTFQKEAERRLGHSIAFSLKRPSGGA